MNHLAPGNLLLESKTGKYLRRGEAAMFTNLGQQKTAMKSEEKAIIHTLNVGGQDVTISKFYGTTVDLSAHMVKIRTSKKMQLGGNVEVMLNVEGHRKPFHLSGVITGIERPKNDAGFLIHISINQKPDGDSSLWKKIFH